MIIRQQDRQKQRGSFWQMRDLGAEEEAGRGRLLLGGLRSARLKQDGRELWDGPDDLGGQEGRVEVPLQLFRRGKQQSSSR